MDKHAPLSKRVIILPASIDPLALYGIEDQALRELERGFAGLSVSARGNQLLLEAPEPVLEQAEELIEELIRIAERGEVLTDATVHRAIEMILDADTDAHTISQVNGHHILVARGKAIRPETPGQLEYVEAIDRGTIIFGIGPAGTGKTYLAMAKAVNALLSGRVKKIILTRPVVEAGESLGYLPGSVTEKIDPYLRPLYDALNAMLDPVALPKLLAAGTIEVAPLAYMRGRTLNDAFIILDEAQNTSPLQMKMFLTRLGFNSKIVVTGDVTQIDLPRGKDSGLAVVEDILDGISEIEFCHLTSTDVVRHHLVARVIEAYARYQEKHG